MKKACENCIWFRCFPIVEPKQFREEQISFLWFKHWDTHYYVDGERVDDWTYKIRKHRWAEAVEKFSTKGRCHLKQVTIDTRKDSICQGYYKRAEEAE
jgi:hypothetical protein